MKRAILTGLALGLLANPSGLLASAPSTDRDVDTQYRSNRQVEAVILGKVLKIELLPKSGPISEHDPDLTLAQIQVLKVISGTYAKQTVVVVFAASDDVMWFRSPKLSVGETAIIRLAKDPKLGRYAVFQPGDVRQVSGN